MSSTTEKMLKQSMIRCRLSIFNSILAVILCLWYLVYIIKGENFVDKSTAFIIGGILAVMILIIQVITVIMTLKAIKKNEAILEEAKRKT